jgi:hypothetical protein
MALRTSKEINITNVTRSMATCLVVTLVGTIVPAVAEAAVGPRVGVHSRLSEATAIKAVRWTSNVTRTIGNGSWTFASDGVPSAKFLATNYAVPSNPFDVSATGASVIASATVLQDQHYDYTLPLTPIYTAKVTSANQGPIGVLLDGAALYNPYEANHSTVATSDNFVATVNGVSASFLDTCDGHPGPGGQYHYHGLPACLVSFATGGSSPVTSVTTLTGTTTSGVSEVNAASKKPVILGFAFDGFGIYDNVAMNGRVIPVSALDACNGIFSPVPGYPHGVYHYVLENVKGARSSIGCFHGIVSSSYTQALASMLSGASSRSTFSDSSSRVAVSTAWSLAANRNEDTLLLAMLRLSGRTRDC